MKKKYAVVSIVLVAFLLIYLLIQRTICFVWVNPYTETKGFSYIGKTLKAINNVLDTTKYFLLLDGKRISYIYQNPYGSGFLKNNPIPNDLDFAVGVNLGTYKYDGTNAEEIATDIVDKMIAFYLQFVDASFSKKNLQFYSTVTSFDILDIISKSRKTNIDDIADNLENIINQKRYVKYTKISNYNDLNIDIIMPYIMEPDSVLIQKSKQLKIYTETIKYNDEMLSYLRELSVIPEFYIKIVSGKETFQFELVPEIFFGTRLQLVRRCFGSTVFDSLGSLNFLRHVDWLRDDDKYIYTRLLSFRRHIEEIENIHSLGKSPVKMLKRIMQCAEMVKPLLSKEDYEMIVDFVKTNLSNRDIVLLNEVQNIYSNLCDIAVNSNLFNSFTHTDKIKKMHTYLVDIQQELEQRGEIDKRYIQELKEANEYVEKTIMSAKTYKDIDKDSEQIRDLEGKIGKLVTKSMYSVLYKPERAKQIVDIYAKVYNDAGFHKVKFVWLDVNRIGVIKNDFTKNIKDFKKFAKGNYLVEDAEYTLVTPQKLKEGRYVTFVRWVQNDMSSEEQAGYEHMRKVLLDDRKNFKPKVKCVFIKN